MTCGSFSENIREHLNDGVYPVVYLSYILPELVCFFFYLLPKLTDLLSELSSMIVYLFIKPLYLAFQLARLIVYLLVQVLEALLSFPFKLFYPLDYLPGSLVNHLIDKLKGNLPDQPFCSLKDHTYMFFLNSPSVK